MKHLNDYVEKEQKILFKKFGVFFAFSKAQLLDGINKNKGVGLCNPGEKHTSFGFGMYCPSKHAKSFTMELDDITKTAIKKDLAKNGKKKIIERELNNHECFVSMDTSNVIKFLRAYDISAEEINATFENILSIVYR